MSISAKCWKENTIGRIGRIHEIVKQDQKRKKQTKKEIKKERKKESSHRLHE
jgi:hypothetical protein